MKHTGEASCALAEGYMFKGAFAFPFIHSSYFQYRSDNFPRENERKKFSKVGHVPPVLHWKSL